MVVEQHEFEVYKADISDKLQKLGKTVANVTGK